MFELVFQFLAVLEDADVLASSLLVLSEDIFATVAFDEEMLGIVYEQCVSSLLTFQRWLAAMVDVSNDVVNALFGLQMLYNMVYTHYQRVQQTKQCISVSTALLDAEATLKKNYVQVVAAAGKEIASPAFAALTPDVQARFRVIATQSPMDYWLSVKQDILGALLKNPLYAH
jgi:hypothetical protein